MLYLTNDCFTIDYVRDTTTTKANAVTIGKPMKVFVFRFITEKLTVN